VWLEFFVANMLRKDKSMSRHDGWDEYKAQSGMLLPSWRVIPASARPFIDGR